MNGYKILKCFRKEKRVSDELPYPVTGLIALISEWSEMRMENLLSAFIVYCTVFQT